MKAKIRVVFYPNVRLQTIAGWHLKIETSKHDCEDDVAGDTEYSLGRQVLQQL